MPAAFKDKVHTMSPKERAAHGIYISSEDFARLTTIAARLSGTYKPDAYEQFWRGRHTHLFGASILLCLLLAVSPAPWWSAPLPFLVVLAFTVHLPWRMWRRRAHAPRWAHPLATLDVAEIETVADVVAHLKPVQRSVAEASLPAATGDKFFEIWDLAQRLRAGHSY